MITKYFNSDEVEELVMDSIKDVIVNTGRWSHTIKSVVEYVDGKYYVLYWEKAATEYREHEFWEQDGVEVSQQTKKVTITDWFLVGEDYEYI